MQTTIPGTVESSTIQQPNRPLSPIAGQTAEAKSAEAFAGASGGDLPPSYNANAAPF